MQSVLLRRFSGEGVGSRPGAGVDIGAAAGSWLELPFPPQADPPMAGSASSALRIGVPHASPAPRFGDSRIPETSGVTALGNVRSQVADRT